MKLHAYLGKYMLLFEFYFVNESWVISYGYSQITYLNMKYLVNGFVNRTFENCSLICEITKSPPKTIGDVVVRNQFYILHVAIKGFMLHVAWNHLAVMFSLHVYDVLRE